MAVEDEEMFVDLSRQKGRQTLTPHTTPDCLDSSPLSLDQPLFLFFLHSFPSFLPFHHLLLILEHIGLIFDLYKLDDSWTQGADEEEEYLTQHKSSLCWSGTHTGFNPLHIAASQGYGSIVILLLALGVDPMEKTAENTIYRLFTPLHLAAQNGHRHVFEAILYFTKNATEIKKYVKERLKEADKDGSLFSTPVDSAATTFFPRIPSHLLRDVNLYDVDDFGMVEENEVAKAQMNVEAPAEGFIAPLSPNQSSEWFNQLLNKKNGEGETALHVATGRGRTEIVNFICDLALSTNIAFLQSEIESISQRISNGSNTSKADQDENEDEESDDDSDEGESDEQVPTSKDMIALLEKRMSKLRKNEKVSQTIGIDEESSRLAGAVLLAAEKADEHLLAPFVHYSSLLNASVSTLLENARNVQLTWNWPSSFSEATSRVLPPWSVINWHRKEISHGDVVMHSVVQAGLQRVFNYNYPLPPASLNALYLLISHSPSYVLHCPSFGIPRSIWSDQMPKDAKQNETSFSSSSAVHFPSPSSISLDLNNDGDHPFDYLLEANADWFEALHAIAFWHSFIITHFAHRAGFRASPSLNQSYPVVWQLLDACEAQGVVLETAGPSTPSSPLFAGVSILLAHIRRYLRFDTDAKQEGDEENDESHPDLIRVPAPFSLPSPAMVAKLGHSIRLEENRKQRRREEEEEAGAAPCKLIDTSTIPFTRKFANVVREDPIKAQLEGAMPPPPAGHPDIAGMEEGASCPLGFKKRTTTQAMPPPPSGHPDIANMAEGATCPLGFKKKISNNAESTPSASTPSSSNAPPSGHPDIANMAEGATCPLGFKKRTVPSESSSSAPSSDPAPPSGHPDISKYPPGAVCPMGFGKKKAPEASTETASSSSSAPPSSDPAPPSGHPDISKYPPGAVCPMGFGKKKATEASTGESTPSKDSSGNTPNGPPSPAHPSGTSFLFEKIILLGAVGALASLAIYRFFGSPS